MAKSSNLYVRIEPNIKQQAEAVLSTLGIPTSTAVNMFYKQIILHKGIPFDLKIPKHNLVDVSTLTVEQMDQELEKGYNEMLKYGKMEINQGFGNLFYSNSDATLILNILRDLSEHLGHTLETPLSLYFVCLDLLIPVEVCDSICIDIFAVFNGNEKEKLLDYKYVKKIMIKYFPEAKNFSELSVKSFLKSVSLSRIPELGELLNFQT